MTYDVAIIGGGPAGSTTGGFLRKYNPDIRVVILEREMFPREHVGESLLPPIAGILDQLGCWDRVEQANFPIKVGATYRWGRHPELWDFDFIPVELFRDESRPGKFEGLRRGTAWQVERSQYDEILLDHAASLGCEVRQQTQVREVVIQGDSVKALHLDSGETIEARHYVDASGNSGILRRALGVDCDYPSSLQNIAIYGYWQNADWKVEIGVGGTRIQIYSLSYGWLWFIPLGPTRTSIGLVLPVDFYKMSGKRPEELYSEAVHSDPIVARLAKNAQFEGKLHTTKDWSFIADRQAGSNWYLVGECGGFADPILSAGVTLAHVGARRLAYTILELDKGELEREWLLTEFDRRQKQGIRTHIRFAEYWYTANEQFTDLKDFTTQLAGEAGLALDPESAWDWIARGGFIDEDSTVAVGGFGLRTLRDSGTYLMDIAVQSPLEENNLFDLDLGGCEERTIAMYANGRVTPIKCYVRNGRVLPVRGRFEVLINVLNREREFRRIILYVESLAKRYPNNPIITDTLVYASEALEAMILDGWIKASYDPTLPLGKLRGDGAGFRKNQDPSNKA